MFHSRLVAYIAKVQTAMPQIDPQRHTILQPLVDYITEHQNDAQLVFICTHNSRRSHFGQIWAQVAAVNYGLQGIKTFSGGTEATAFHPNAQTAIRRAGMTTKVQSASTNPVIEISIGPEVPAFTAFSKVFDDSTNPAQHFAAVMTCAEADADCPFVPGADVRIPLHYEDPKVSDGTADMERIYDERCFQIATEMFYAFQKAIS